MYNIEFIGNEHTNKSSRNGYVPMIIVDHISEGGESSVKNWGTSPNNNQSSWHFFVTRKGKIYQFVNIEDMAWANGLTLEQLPGAPAEIVREKKVNPNLYSVSIEHEGFYYEKHGDLTEEQFQASVWLHKYIKQYVKEKWGHEIIFDRKHVIGHYEIDPINKVHCPGEKFPWEKLMKELNEKEQKIEVIKKKVKISIHGNIIEQDVLYEPGVNYVPIRFLEQLGYSLSWNAAQEVIEIKYKE